MNMSNDLVTLTDKQKKAQRSRSLALALALAAFVIVVYVGTWAKIGANHSQTAPVTRPLQ
ncbi:multidrug resistance efflux pump [Phyllobacterium endophyticum]|jgi:hypothetical protein|uniref:CoxF protein n=1 Tax=Phyllobacterium endophyticum TaxID=1149773 RepID=A0A2P7B1L6_9HYPH|nr:hypothetical protein [Phyllobacterium endophyticum]MBB3237923.1 multidrug resistance efflux pump [Phyllobacterium endophyticum]PSH60350.1 hypothetical protein CU100_06605 [Phyllobacterium endophyticum]TXR48104.1 hypothetical protein FVA77_16245 [Phyllobacterium endophyticum]TYR42527.1 hypothetical protein FY050_15150 [Phyllobacterium endophyticum]